MASASRRTPSLEREPRRKDVLYCPSCAHESPVDGDWRRRMGSGRVVYGCPDCGTDVTARPSREPGGSLVAHSVGLAVATFRATLVWATWPLRHWRFSTR